MTEFVMAAPARRHARGAGRVAALVTAGCISGALIGAMVVAIVATRFFGYEVLTVTSGSMAPAIVSGDLVVVRPAAMKDLQAGDVVLFEAGGDGIPTIHRVAGINEVELNVTDRATGQRTTMHDYRLVTKGDANPEVDPGEVTAGAFRGEMWFAVPHAGAVFGHATEALFIGVAALVVMAWIAWELANRWRRRA